MVRAAAGGRPGPGGRALRRPPPPGGPHLRRHRGHQRRRVGRAVRADPGRRWPAPPSSTRRCGTPRPGSAPLVTIAVDGHGRIDPAVVDGPWSECRGRTRSPPGPRPLPVGQPRGGHGPGRWPRSSDVCRRMRGPGPRRRGGGRRARAVRPRRSRRRPGVGVVPQARGTGRRRCARPATGPADRTAPRRWRTGAGPSRAGSSTWSAPSASAPPPRRWPRMTD